ncbi:DUF3231 family protein [Neobacillus kokaensis]|uniref:DUF3231 family protein n=1 Tax=Neobacillus kokaensis TaxID=2759023 RepID=A0ABQ3N191_9BACI|nr:DUF3231 family protein [Neobacillus kokaensis]GHH98690.1 hypothetical protein AM1BK_22330 [Neobacillus kokaensis]
MNSEQHIRLTSSEIAQLWTGYMNNSMSMCVLKYFKEKTEDEEIRNVLDFAISISDKMLQDITEIYVRENHPIPVAFNESEDVNLNAPAIYSDVFMLNFVHYMSRYGMTAYGSAFASSARSDIVELFTMAVESCMELYKKSLTTLLEKGLYHRVAAIPIPEKVDFVQKQSYLTGWFGERRPLNAAEIMNLYNDIQRNALGKALLLGFGQSAGLQQVRNYMVKGAQIAGKVVDVLTHILMEENITEPPTWDSEVLNSTTPAFSDKLMMFHSALLISASSGYYGTALGTSGRRDIGAKYSRLLIEALQYAEDGAHILIEQGWMEQLPQSSDEIEIAKIKKK